MEISFFMSNKPLNNQKILAFFIFSKQCQILNLYRKYPSVRNYDKFYVFEIFFEAENTLGKIDFLLGSIYLSCYGYSEHIWV